MISFKQYILEQKKKITEDKLLTKEEDGGSVSGEVSSPTANTTPTSDIVKQGGNVTYDEILGHCDHEKDGYLGPHCFHKPYNVFSKVMSRIPKKNKKRKIIVQELTEEERNSYTLFLEDAKEILQNELKNINSDLKKIDPDLNAVYDENYDFSGDREDWVAALNKEEQDDINTFLIGMNFKVLYEFLDEMGLELDETEITCQIRASIYHEIAHGLIQWFQDKEIYDFELSEKEEEKVAEEYANFKLGQYTNVKSSKLQNFIDEMFN